MSITNAFLLLFITLREGSNMILLHVLSILNHYRRTPADILFAYVVQHMLLLKNNLDICV